MIQQSHSWAYIQKRQELLICRYMHPNVQSSAMTVAKTQKQPKCPLINQ